MKTCPDMKKMVADPSEKGKCVPTQYHLAGDNKNAALEV